MAKNVNFLEFYSSENYKNQIEVWYKVYNIIRERTELFHDFVITLYEIINESYLGPEYIKTDLDQRKHYDWCWNKVIKNFEKESIHFKENGSHKEYLLLFFQEAFYLNEDESFKIKEYFDKLFKYDYQKTRSELDMFTEIYKLLENNLKT